MGPEGRRGWRAIGAIVGLTIAMAMPVQASALDSDLKGSAVFRLKASNGYSILGFAASERIDGRGDLGLIVYRSGMAAVYEAPAVVTPTRLEADLGSLGMVAVDIVPSGRKTTVRSRCGGDPQVGEPDFYRGTLEFHGEEGYTEAVATRASEYGQFLLDLGCATGDRGGFGPGRSGALLRGRMGGGHHRLVFEVKKNRSGAPSRLSAEISERHGGVTIDREVSTRAGAGVFAYDPLLQTATLDPPTPFSGRAAFRRSAPAADLWTGNLMVDFPGKSGVSLTDPNLQVSLVPALPAAGF